MSGREPPLVLDHVALLVADLERALGRITSLLPDVPVGPIEAFPSEGTREAYLGASGARGRLLLLQPHGPGGPYARALERRGPGLHHVAFAVPAPRAALAGLPGWLLHPRSVETLERARTLWLCRPGVAALVELMTGEPPAGPPLITALEVEASIAGASALLAPLGLVAAPAARLTVGAATLLVRELT